MNEFKFSASAYRAYPDLDEAAKFPADWQDSVKTLSVFQAAAIVKMHPSTVHRWCLAETLFECIAVGSSIRDFAIDSKSFAQFIRSNTNRYGELSVKLSKSQRANIQSYWPGYGITYKKSSPKATSTEAKNTDAHSEPARSELPCPWEEEEKSVSSLVFEKAIEGKNRRISELERLVANINDTLFIMFKLKDDERDNLIKKLIIMTMDTNHVEKAYS